LFLIVGKRHYVNEVVQRERESESERETKRKGGELRLSSTQMQMGSDFVYEEKKNFSVIGLNDKSALHLLHQKTMRRERNSFLTAISIKNRRRTTATRR
jgi:hypothetical protein